MKTCDYCTHVEMCGWLEEVKEQGCEFFDDGIVWIPCSERLPDTNDKVLVTIIENEYGDTKMYFGSYAKSIQLWMVEDRVSYFTNVEVIAWMPLPEPYKGGDTE